MLRLLELLELQLLQLNMRIFSKIFISIDYFEAAVVIHGVPIVHLFLLDGFFKNIFNLFFQFFRCNSHFLKSNVHRISGGLPAFLWREKL